jgi:phosphatidate cytidylyltransferase
MDPTSRQILILSASILLGFGILVVIWSVHSMWKGKEIRTLWKRYLAWFVIAPVIVLPLVFSRAGFQCLVLLLSLLCFREYSRVVGLWKDRKIMLPAVLAIVLIYAPVFTRWYGLYQAVPIYGVALILIVPIFRDEFENMIQKTCLGMLGVVYFGWFLSHLACLRNFEEGIQYIFYLIVLVEANDAFGYLWGSLLGKHKLVPKISPNKTIEGALGAVVSVILLGFLMRYLIPRVCNGHVFILAFMLSIFGTCGDLTISFIKRDLRIKDMGNLIPGHGGLLDRCDSIIFTAPLYFHFMRFFYE